MKKIITLLLLYIAFAFGADYKEQRKDDRTVKKDETFKTFGYKRPIAK